MYFVKDRYGRTIQVDNIEELLELMDEQAAQSGTEPTLTLVEDEDFEDVS